MKLFRVFGIGSQKILAKNCSVPATVSRVDKSYLYVIKKPVRLGITEQNTQYSHYIHFTYGVTGTEYRGKLFINPNYRCPQKGERIDVFYDPENPEDYACYAFGPNATIMGW